jgi:hypothetical protein
MEIKPTPAEIQLYLEDVEDELYDVLEPHEIKKVVDKRRKEIEGGDIHQDLIKHIQKQRDFKLVFNELFRRAANDKQSL